jgi:hypothetical protein
VAVVTRKLSSLLPQNRQFRLFESSKSNFRPKVINWSRALSGSQSERSAGGHPAANGRLLSREKIIEAAKKEQNREGR